MWFYTLWRKEECLHATFIATEYQGKIKILLLSTSLEQTLLDYCSAKLAESLNISIKNFNKSCKWQIWTFAAIDVWPKSEIVPWVTTCDGPEWGLQASYGKGLQPTDVSCLLSFSCEPLSLTRRCSSSAGTEEQAKSFLTDAESWKSFLFSAPTHQLLTLLDYYHYHSRLLFSGRLLFFTVTISANVTAAGTDRARVFGFFWTTVLFETQSPIWPYKQGNCDSFLTFVR